MEAYISTAIEEDDHWARKAFETIGDYKLYIEPDWQVAPDSVEDDRSINSWGQCVNGWRFATCGSKNGRLMIAIEIALNNMASHRHLLFADQVKSVVTKTDISPTFNYTRVEKVVIDIHKNVGWSYTPDQVTLMFIGPANSLAFQKSLVEFLGNW